MLFNKLLPDFATEVGNFLRVASFLPPIPWDADVVRAFARRALAVDTEMGNTFTLGVMAIAKTLRTYDLGGAIDEWKEQKANAVREPIANRLADLEDELKRSERATVEISYELVQQERNGVIRRFGFWMFGVFFVMAAILTPFWVAATKPTAWLLYLGVGLVALAGYGSVGSFAVLLLRRSRQSPIELGATKLALERKIRDLIEERARYRTLMIADTDELLSKRDI